MFKNLVFLIFILPFMAYSQNKISYKVYYDENLAKNGLKVQVDYTLRKASDTLSFYYTNENWDENDLLKTLFFYRKKTLVLSSKWSLKITE